MYYIKPISVLPSMLDAATTVAEDPTIAWTAGTYAIGDERHVVATHTVYKCAMAGSSTVSPELDTNRWQAMRPTNRMAAFDGLTSTQSQSTTDDLVWVINGVRFCNAIDMHALAGASYEVQVHESAGGALLATRTGRLRAQPRGLWDLLFGEHRPVRRLRLKNLPIRPAAQITIKIKAAPTARRAVGMIVLGKHRALMGRAQWGGTEYGATAIPINHSRIDTRQGITTVVEGLKATDLRFTLVVPRQVANDCLREIQELMGQPLSISAADVVGYESLSTFGLIRSAPMSHPHHGAIKIDFDVMGLT